MTGLLISQGVLVIVVFGLLWANLKARRQEFEALERESSHRNIVAQSMSALLRDAMHLKDEELSQTQERLTTLLRLAPRLESLIDRAEHLRSIDRVAREFNGDENEDALSMPSALTGGRNQYSEPELE